MANRRAVTQWLANSVGEMKPAFAEQDAPKGEHWNTAVWTNGTQEDIGRLPDIPLFQYSVFFIGTPFA